MEFPFSLDFFSSSLLFSIRTLATYLNSLEHPLEEGQILKIFQQVVSAIHYMHSLHPSILHRFSFLFLHSSILPNPPLIPYLAT